MPVTISEMLAADYPTVYALWLASEGMGLSAADGRENVEGFLLRNPGLSIVARSGQRIVAAALCGHDGRRGYLYHLAVAEGFRHQGIGRQMVNACVEKLSAAGIQRGHIFVFANNATGLTFWNRMGWTERKDLISFSQDPLSRDDM